MAKKKKNNKLQAFWKKMMEHRGWSATIAALAVALIVAIVVLIIMVSDKKGPPKGDYITISPDFYHAVPEDLDIKNAVSVKNDTNAKEILSLEGGYSLDVEPVPHENGWYVFDSDGIGRKYRDENGKVHNLPEEEWYDGTLLVGNPLQIFGELKLHFVVYKDNEFVARCFRYYVLSDKADMEYLLEALKSCGIVDVKQVSDTVAEVEMDAGEINDELLEVSKDSAEVFLADMSYAKYLVYLEERYGVKTQK